MNWENLLKREKEKPYFKGIYQHLETEKNNSITIYPPEHLRYSALEATPLNQVKVVILGQDPYHGPNEAHGLSFSVQHGVKIPPSLRNIFTELNDDLGISAPQHGDLTPWAKQGVLLLNTSLSVAHKQPGSHSNIGWHTFTDKIISEVSTHRPFVVFVLWGKHAQSKEYLIDERHVVMKTAHPSPLSAHRGFKGSKPFSTVNTSLLSQKMEAIKWGINSFKSLPNHE